MHVIVWLTLAPPSVAPRSPQARRVQKFQPRPYIL